MNQHAIETFCALTDGNYSRIRTTVAPDLITDKQAQQVMWGVMAWTLREDLDDDSDVSITARIWMVWQAIRQRGKEAVLLGEPGCGSVEPTQNGGSENSDTPHARTSASLQVA